MANLFNMFGSGLTLEDGVLVASDTEQFNAYLSTAAVTFTTTPFTIPFNVEPINTDTGTFSIAAGVVTVVPAGRYEVFADVTGAATAGDSAFRVDAWIEVDGVEVTGTRRSLGASA